MNELEFHELMMRVCEKAEGITVLSPSKGIELSTNRKIEALIGIRADVAKRWILGHSIPPEAYIERLRQFLEDSWRPR